MADDAIAPGSRSELRALASDAIGAAAAHAEVTKEAIKLPASMGLQGITAIVANVSAVVLMGGLFAWLVTDMVHTNRENTALMRTAIEKLHSDMNRLTNSVDRLSSKIK